MNTYSRKEVGKCLQQLRKQAGYKSAAAFAEELGIKVGTYTTYEQGKASFSIETAWDMADVLDVTLDELVGREWPPGSSPALTADERKLVDDYRRADESDRPALASMAAAVAYAGEAKNEGKVGAVELVGDDVSGDAR